MKHRWFAVLLAFTVIVSAGACKSRKGPIGSEKNPLQLWFMPLKDESVYQKHAPAIEKYLESKTGLQVETKLADSFIDIVKAMGKKKADAAFMNTLGYLLAHDWAGVDAKLQYLYGDVYTTYRGEIITKVGNGINKPADLNGRSFAFTDPYSAAGYLYALKYLKDNKIKPSLIMYSGGHIKAVEMVYSGAVDAAATYHEYPGAGGEAKDARIELSEKYPDILGVVKILSLTSEIPDGPIATRKGLPTEISDKIMGALKEYAETPEGRTALMELYNVTGLTEVDNSAYDGVRKVVKQMGKEIQEMVKGGVPYYRTSIEIGLD
jgi:phosphonate transport system substrate-binding protein